MTLEVLHEETGGKGVCTTKRASPLIYSVVLETRKCFYRTKLQFMVCDVEDGSSCFLLLNRSYNYICRHVYVFSLNVKDKSNLVYLRTYYNDVHI